MEHQCDRRPPSQVSNNAWLVAYRQQQNYPCIANGKWLVYATRDKIDNLWKIIALATDEGYLGSFSKVSTIGLPDTTKTGIHIICIYTYDPEDREDIIRVRTALRELNITHPIPYQTWNPKTIVTLYKE